jgi:hypothetical protein
MKNLERREFLKNLASTLAVSTAGLTFQSCSTIRGAYRQRQGGEDVDEILACLKEHNKIIAENEGLRFAEDFYRECGCNPHLLQDSLVSLLDVGTFGDLSEKQRQHPDVQQMLWDAAPVMDRAILCTTTYLENLTPEDRLKIQKAMKEHPEILKTFQVEFDAAARKQNIPSNRLDHFNAMFNQCAWRLENQDPSMLIDDVVTMTDKACREFCITPEDRKRIAAEQCEVSNIDNKQFNRNMKANKSNNTDSSENKRYKKMKRRRNIGLKMMGIGLVQAGLGTALVVLSDDVGGGGFWIGATLGWTAGGIIFLIGMIMAISGGIGMAKNKEDSKKETSKEEDSNKN